MDVYKSNNQFLYYDAKEQQTFSYIAPIVIKIIGVQKELRILEFGCGNGHFCNVLSTTGHNVVGVDVSETGIEHARKNFPGIQFIQSDICTLLTKPVLAEESFDVVVAIEIIEHLWYPREIMRAAKKYLKPDGQFIISTPYHGYLKNLAISLFNKWDRHFSVEWDIGHVKFFSVKTLKRVLEDEAFRNIRFEFAGRIPAFWKSMVCISKR
jgi:2-polyprenyl-3-methyl-5-hydroxy-6-metoxy-1,4-benzoquinol methylase